MRDIHEEFLSRSRAPDKIHFEAIEVGRYQELF